MKKKVFLVLFSVLLLVFLSGCATKEGKEFKKEYEALNGTTNKSGKAHRTISIPKDNPFVKVEASEIVKMINNKETFYVYFGDPLCPWCRSVLEKSIEVAKKNKIDKIYYVKIWDKDGNEILRNKYVINGTDVEETIDKSETYTKLLEAFDPLLTEYTLTAENGDKIDLEEKRIYAPNYIYVKDGVINKLVEGISSKQTDSREELTKEMLDDEERIFSDFFKN